MQASIAALDIVGGEVMPQRPQGWPVHLLAKIAAEPRAEIEDARQRAAGALGRGLVQCRAPSLSLRQPYRRGAGRPRHRRRDGRALCHRLRHRPRHQSGAGRGPDRRRLPKGLGGALFEEFTFNERGDPLPSTFADYLLPTLRETADLDILAARGLLRRPLNPLGIKGAGESGITGVGGAIASAIDDAIGIPGAVTRLPVTPQRLKELLAQRTPLCHRPARPAIQ